MSPDRGDDAWTTRVASTPTFLIISGPPASGKSTLAPGVAARCGLPLLAKDTIKDALMAVLPVLTVEASRDLGRAAVEAMLALAEQSPVGAVLESNFYRSVVADRLRSLPGPVIELFCRCPRQEMERRYRQRAGSRHAGHFDHLRLAEELWDADICEPVAGGWPVVEVDTSAPVDLDALVRSLPLR